MNIELITTADGSHTLYRPDLDEHYHSMHGAINESMHIYIECGLRQISKPLVRIFEVGFGTGLNAILSLIECEKTNRRLIYDSIEKYPLDVKLIRELNYIQFIPVEYHPAFYNLHNADWNKTGQMACMIFEKISGDIRSYRMKGEYDLVYFDPFSPEKEPELWTKAILGKMFDILVKGGYLVSYSVKGDIRRRLMEIGFKVERLPGPSGKKQILRAVK